MIDWLPLEEFKLRGHVLIAQTRGLPREVFGLWLQAVKVLAREVVAEYERSGAAGLRVDPRSQFKDLEVINENGSGRHALLIRLALRSQIATE